jgi:hypothetical protein
VRAPTEPPNARVEAFYAQLLPLLRDEAFRNGTWQLLECVPAWEGNPSFEAFIAYGWRYEDRLFLVVVNYAAHASQCYLRLPYLALAGRRLRLDDLMSAASYERDGATLFASGLYLDLPAWHYHVFAVRFR